MRPIKRVVFDTSSLVGAALRIGSTPHQALLKALDSAEFCASAESLADLEVVLSRKKFDRYLDSEERHRFLANLSRRASLFVVEGAGAMEMEPPCRDPADNKFLALALAAEADALVSSDADLLVLHPWRGIPIITPGDFVAEFQEPPTP